MPLPICSVNLAPSVHPGDLRNPNGYRWMLSQVLVFKHCQRHLRQLRRSCCMCLAILVPTALRHQVMIFSTSTLWTYFWSLYWEYFWPGLNRRYNLQDFNETQKTKFQAPVLWSCRCFPWCFLGLAVVVWRSSERCRFVLLGSCPRAIWHEPFWLRQSWNEKEAIQAPGSLSISGTANFFAKQNTLKCLM